MIFGLMISGCIEDITTRFREVPVMRVNLNVVMQNNETIIQNMEARLDAGTWLSKTGNVIPESYPSIYVEVLQMSENSKAANKVSMINGKTFNGPGNYSFNVQLYETKFNKSWPVSVYSEIIDKDGKRIARNNILVFNYTE